MMEDGQSGVDGQVQVSQSAAAQGLGEHGIRLAPVMPAQEQGQAGGDPNDDAGQTPLIIESQLEKEGDADHERQHADAGHPVAAEQLLPFDGFPWGGLAPGQRWWGAGTLPGFHGGNGCRSCGVCRHPGKRWGRHRSGGTLKPFQDGQTFSHDHHQFPEANDLVGDGGEGGQHQVGSGSRLGSESRPGRRQWRAAEHAEAVGARVIPVTVGTLHIAFLLPGVLPDDAGAGDPVVPAPLVPVPGDGQEAQVHYRC
jgi:hypothetical protein